MRREDLKFLEKLYPEPGGERQFNSAIGADVPHAGELTSVILIELDENNFGIPFFHNLPVHERILISDYLYQCVSSIEVNLAEAKLHYLEWRDYTEQISRRYADIVGVDNGQVFTKMAPSVCALDDLPNAFEKLHVCGFFRAIGSALDCIGGTMVALLGLPCPLRSASLGAARGAMKNLGTPTTRAKAYQADFANYLETEINKSKPANWPDWSMQYRNMFVHRGRRTSMGHFNRSKVLLYDNHGNEVPRVETASHLSVDPDKSDIEAMIYNRTIILDEEAEITLTGVFKNTRDLLENICEKLLLTWQERKADPSLIAQPASQWKPDFKNAGFQGFAPETESLEMDMLVGHPTMMKRLKAASALDHQRNLWQGTDWVK
jgi:hypothetical protein